MLKSKSSRWLAGPYLVWMAIFTVVPLFIVIWYAMTNADGQFTFDNLTQIGRYSSVFARSLILAAISTVICLVMAFPVGYFLSRLRANKQHIMLMLIMLPMWRSCEEVSRFLALVNGRCRTMLLLETKEADACLDEVLRLSGIDMVHIGLNDLHLSYARTFMFELLTDGTVERICERLRAADKPYGFGGVGRIGTGMLPAEHILGEHVRLGSQMAILSRSFCDVTKAGGKEEVAEIFTTGMRELRACEAAWATATAAELSENRAAVCREVAAIAAAMKKGR